MAVRPSKRIADFVAAQPLRPGMRVLEIGCGPGVAARLVLARMPDLAERRRANAEEIAKLVAGAPAGSFLAWACRWQE